MSSRHFPGHDGGYAFFNDKTNEIGLTELSKDVQHKRYDPRLYYRYRDDIRRERTSARELTRKHLDIFLDHYDYDVDSFDTLINGQFNPGVWKQWMGCNVSLPSIVKYRNYLYGPPHHVSHAYSALVQSPFENCAVLSYDGGSHQGLMIFGEFNKKSEFNFKRYHYQPGSSYQSFRDFSSSLNEIQNIIKRQSQIYPTNNHELFLTSALWDYDLAGKAMGLSAYGEIDEQLLKCLDDAWDIEFDPFSNYCQSSPYDPEYEMKDPRITRAGANNWNLKFIKTHKEYVDNFRIPWSRVTEVEEANRIFTNFCATNQLAMENWVIKFLQKPEIKKIIDRNDGKLIITGGCALNVLVNQKVRDVLGIDVWVPPHCSDEGHALGGLMHHLYTNNIVDPQFRADLTYKGSPLFKNGLTHQINKRFRTTDIKEVVNKIEQGKILGLISGRSEFGPRALGHRSIICDPSYPDMKDKLNRKVKHREWFRPFAPMCRLQDVKKYFDNSHNFGDMSYMSFAVKVKEKYKKMFPSITHVDGTARLQTVRKDNPETRLIYELLDNMSKEKILLNTSLNFNLEEPKPILNDLNIAIGGLRGSGLDYILLEYDNKLYITTEQAKYI